MKIKRYLGDEQNHVSSESSNRAAFSVLTGKAEPLIYFNMCDDMLKNDVCVQNCHNIQMRDGRVMAHMAFFENIPSLSYNGLKLEFYFSTRFST